MVQIFFDIADFGNDIDSRQSFILVVSETINVIRSPSLIFYNLATYDVYHIFKKD